MPGMLKHIAFVPCLFIKHSSSRRIGHLQSKDILKTDHVTDML